MRHPVHTVLVSLASVLALAKTTTPAEAQEIGIGVGVRSSFISNVQSPLTPTIYVPIGVTDRIMIEPELGIIRLSEEDDGFDETLTFLTIGAGLLFEIGDMGEHRIYAGPRLGIVRTSFSEELDGGGEFSDSTTNLFLAGVLGGEFFLEPNFSLGGEAGLRYQGTGDDESDGSLITTTAEFRIRWYFL
jgi:hypothetical protein